MLDTVIEKELGEDERIIVCGKNLFAFSASLSFHAQVSKKKKPRDNDATPDLVFKNTPKTASRDTLLEITGPGFDNRPTHRFLTAPRNRVSGE